MRRALSFRSAATVTLVYSLLTLALTWPVCATLAERLPGDLGDPLLNTWILGWDLDHLARFFSSGVTAFDGLWDANIFHPEPLALAYSEHLLPLAAQALPVYLLTSSLLLCYNLLFLSTFVLSALGVYLLVRDFTRSGATAFVAGLFFGFGLYRIDQIGHLQVLSSQWMPFALLGFWRFAEGRRPAPLVGAAVALVVQGLSCGYHLFFFWPFAAAFAVWALWRNGRWREAALWRALGLALACVVLAVLPFLLPYAQLRGSGAIARTQAELSLFSADVCALGRADRTVRLWGRVRLPGVAPLEGDLFPGLVPLALAALGVGATLRGVRATPGRTRLAAVLRRPCVFSALAALAAALLALGPVVRVAGRALAPGPYAWLYRFVPGFDGLRAPSRFGMVFLLFVALAAADGIRLLATRRRTLAVAGAAALFLLEGAGAPLRTNQILRDRGLRRTPPLELPFPAIYGDVQRLPGDAILIELPLGAPGYDVRAAFYSTTHWRRLVNGYSGAQPSAYGVVAAQLRDPAERPHSAWAVLSLSGATHAVVHQAAWRAPRGDEVSAWLTSHGARRVAQAGEDVLFELPGRTQAWSASGAGRSEVGTPAPRCGRRPGEATPAPPLAGRFSEVP